MATHDYVIANASGAAVRADLNNALAAIVSNNSNATSPATTYAFQFWADTTANQLKIRNAANDAWITLMELDGTMLMEDGSAASPGLAFADDVDTGLFRPAANQLGIATSGVERVEFGTTEVVFNDSGADVDFRVEGDAEASLFVVDAGNDRIGIAESAPGTLVEIGSEAPYVTLKNSTEEDTDGGRESRLIFEGEQSGGEISTLAQIEVSHDGTADDEQGKLVISTNDGSDGASPTAALTISADQTVAVEDNLTVNGVQYPTAGPLSNRNLIINGAMNVAQRSTSAVTVSNNSNEGYSTLDRWHLNFNDSLGGAVSFEQSSDSPDGFANSIKIQCSTTESSLTGNQSLSLSHRIEAQNVQLLSYGSSGAVKTTLSWYMKVETYDGPISVNLRARDGTEEYYTISVTPTTSWARYSLVIPESTSATIDDNNGEGLRVSFFLAANTSGVNAASSDSTAWSTTRSDYRDNIGNLLSNTSNAFYITGVQLEVGEKATPFEHRIYSDELLRCERYFEVIGGRSEAFLGYAYTTSAAVASIRYRTVKRDIPGTITLSPAGQSTGQLTFLTAGGSYPTTTGTNTVQVISAQSFRASGSGYTGLTDDSPSSFYVTGAAGETTTIATVDAEL